MAEAVPLRPTPAVRLAGDTLRIDALTVTDQAVIAYASGLAESEPERFVLDALSVGALGFMRGGPPRGVAASAGAVTAGVAV